jgi:hypothetical protein
MLAGALRRREMFRWGVGRKRMIYNGKIEIRTKSMPNKDKVVIKYLSPPTPVTSV